jgi:phosphate transport system substrate-binding protein
MKLRSRGLMALIAILSLVVAACGGDGGDTTTTEVAGSNTTTTEDMGGETGELGLPIIDPLDVDASADIGIAGSSTVFPLSTEVLSQWIDEGGPEYTIDSIGSGGGLERFCVEGASDIANASRQIDDDEIAACTDTWGTAPIEVRVGSDALSLVVSNGNYFANELTLEEIATAFSLTSADATCGRGFQRLGLTPGRSHSR